MKEIVQPPTGLAIDIEIDEPYDGRTGKPHHCVDRNKDSQRNRFLLEINWVVIRFSELQVVKYPDSSCKVIAKIILQITADYRDLVRSQNVDDLLPHKQWTTKETFYMYKNKFRNSYLTGIFYPSTTSTSSKLVKHKFHNTSKSRGGKWGNR